LGREARDELASDWAARLGQPEEAARRDDSLDEFHERRDVARLVEDIGGQDDREAAAGKR
jgi:hypothetical protein